MGEVVLSANETILTPNTKSQSLYIGYNSDEDLMYDVYENIILEMKNSNFF